ncbi:TMEM175 family protein [Enterococcus sp. AZ103]|uniref:TMEM175 family protein n=1 Tax=Enterococcus sp. AZ103 TaxID=2774628 RepID=UPI003F24CE51
MKERVVVFGDAIIAIILTIMVLELPVKYFANGAVNMTELLRAIGIYFISFCFVANIWFQGAYSFNRITEVKNRTLVVYLMMLFTLSLVPSATRLLIEDTTRQTIIIYGVLTFIVTLISRRLNASLELQILDGQQRTRRKQELDRQDMFTMIVLVCLLIFSWFFVRTALIVYLIMPIMAFLQNMIDREENNFVDTLDQDEQNQYYQNRKEIVGNNIQRYGRFLRDSLKDSSTQNDPEKFQAVINEWQQRLQVDIAERKKQLANEMNPKEQHKIENELRNLDRMSQKLAQRGKFPPKRKNRGA